MPDRRASENSWFSLTPGQQPDAGGAGIVWFDAHGDVQTLETTASGYLGGLPPRLLAGYRPELIADRLGLRPVAENRILLAGARDLDPPEVTYLAAAQIRRCEVTDLTVGLPGAGKSTVARMLLALPRSPPACGPTTRLPPRTSSSTTAARLPRRWRIRSPAWSRACRTPVTPDDRGLDRHQPRTSWFPPMTSPGPPVRKAPIPRDG